MWDDMKTWLKEGGEIPNLQSLCDDLTGPEVILDKGHGVVQLESKHDMKSRGIPSPNEADALALTFAFPVNTEARYARDSVYSEVTGRSFCMRRR